MKSETNQGSRKRKTVSFKVEIYEEIEKLRGGKTFSTFLNDFLKDKFNNKLKGGNEK